MQKIWRTSKRVFNDFGKTLVMAILNVTPDSFSDGGKFNSIDNALRQAEKLIGEGADILDIGGESTRPKSARVATEEEVRRVVPIIEEISKRFETAISIDTSKSEVAREAVAAGAEIINDVSGLRFDDKIAEVAAISQAGLILMHLRGTFETMHELPPVENILDEVSDGLAQSVGIAKNYGVSDSQIVLDVGIGFSKTAKQNLELIAKLDKICTVFSSYPILVGTSRKSFIGKLLGDLPTDERLYGSLASAAISTWNGANIVRVHDVRQTVESLKIVQAIRENI